MLQNPGPSTSQKIPQTENQCQVKDSCYSDDSGQPPLTRDDLNRVHEELEKLNIATDVINRLECSLDSGRAEFRETQSKWGHKLEQLRKKLGQCIAKSRPYYEARLQARHVAEAGQAAAIGFERAVSMHQVAKQQVALTQDSLVRQKGSPTIDPACLEVLNHHIQRVNEAERERMEMAERHRIISASLADANEKVHVLERECSRAIKKSRPYFDARLEFTRILEEQKAAILRLEREIKQKKADYTQSLRNLEHISERIHLERKESQRENKGKNHFQIPPPPSKTSNKRGHMRRASSSNCIPDSPPSLNSEECPKIDQNAVPKVPRHPMLKANLSRKRSLSESVTIGLNLNGIGLDLDDLLQNGQCAKNSSDGSPLSPDAAAMRILSGERGKSEGGHFSERLYAALAGRHAKNATDVNVFAFSPDHLDLTYRTNPAAVKSEDYNDLEQKNSSPVTNCPVTKTPCDETQQAQVTGSPSANSQSNVSLHSSTSGDRKSVASSGVSSMADEQLVGMIRSHREMIQEIDQLAERAKTRARTLVTEIDDETQQAELACDQTGSSTVAPPTE